MADEKRTIFIGDVHGCIEELDELLAKLELRPGDRLGFLGDLVDKGPRSVEVIRSVEKVLADFPGSFCAAGNHEETAIRKHRQDKEGEPWTKEASESDWRFLESLPLLVRVPEYRVVAVHGGFYPKFFVDYPEGVGEIPKEWHKGGGKRMDRLRRVLRVRNVSAADRDYLALGEEKPGDPHWSEAYDGREGFAFFGHDPLVGKTRLTNHACGIDTGCCFGGTLTAAVIREGWSRDKSGEIEFVSVQAKKQYAELRVMPGE